MVHIKDPFLLIEELSSLAIVESVVKFNISFHSFLQFVFPTVTGIAVAFKRKMIAVGIGLT